MIELTKRQKEVLKVWVEQGSMKEASEHLGIATKTVEYHLNKIRKRLGIGPLTWLAIWAFGAGLVTLTTSRRIFKAKHYGN